MANYIESVLLKNVLLRFFFYAAILILFFRFINNESDKNLLKKQSSGIGMCTLSWKFNVGDCCQLSV